MDKADSALLKAVFFLGFMMMFTIFEITNIVHFTQLYKPSEGTVIRAVAVIAVMCFIICFELLLGIRYALEFIDRMRHPDMFEPEPDEELDEASAAMQEAGLLTTDDDDVIRWDKDDQLYLCLDNGYIGGFDLLLRKVDDEWQLFSRTGAPVSIERAQRLKTRLCEIEIVLRDEFEPTAS